MFSKAFYKIGWRKLISLEHLKNVLVIFIHCEYKWVRLSATSLDTFWGGGAGGDNGIQKYQI